MAAASAAGTSVTNAGAQEHVRLADKYGSSIVTITHCPADGAGINALPDQAIPEQDGFGIVECGRFVGYRRVV